MTFFLFFVFIFSLKEASKSDSQSVVEQIHSKMTMKSKSRIQRMVLHS